MSDALYETVLIAADDRDGLAAVLERAAQIEHYTGATLHVAATYYDAVAELSDAGLSPAETQALIDKLLATRNEALATALAPFKSRVADLQTRAVWAKDAAAGLIAEAIRLDASLLLKPRQAHTSLADYLHAPVDWRLMRDAPCPVLFSGRSDWRKRGVVLAALDAADVNHEALNRSILRNAGQFQRILDTELHLVSAYPDLGQTVDAYQVAEDFKGLKEQMQSNRTARLKAFVGELALTGVQLHVVEGKPRRVIENLAAELGAMLVVVGTAARSGIGKLLIGNTAEDISRHLTTDLLTVRE